MAKTIIAAYVSKGRAHFAGLHETEERAMHALKQKGATPQNMVIRKATKAELLYPETIVQKIDKVISDAGGWEKIKSRFTIKGTLKAEPKA